MKSMIQAAFAFIAIIASAQAEQKLDFLGIENAPNCHIGLVCEGLNADEIDCNGAKELLADRRYNVLVMNEENSRECENINKQSGGTTCTHQIKLSVSIDRYIGRAPRRTRSIDTYAFDPAAPSRSNFFIDTNAEIGRLTRRKKNNEWLFDGLKQVPNCKN